MMASMQTWWDKAQQLIRKMLALVAGALIAGGIITETQAALYVGVAVEMIDLVWWLWWNRSAVTVAGLEASPVDGTNAAAAAVSNVLAKPT